MHEAVRQSPQAMTSDTRSAGNTIITQPRSVGSTTVYAPSCCAPKAELSPTTENRYRKAPAHHHGCFSQATA